MIFSKFTKFPDQHHNPVSEHFQQPYKIPGVHLTVNHCFQSPPCSSLRQPLIYFLFLEICLFWPLRLNGIISWVVFCIWLLSLSIMFLRLISVVARISTSSLFMVKQYYFLWLYHILFTHSPPVDGYPGCFTVLKNDFFECLKKWTNKSVVLPTPMLVCHQGTVVTQSVHARESVWGCSTSIKQDKNTSSNVE